MIFFLIVRINCRIESTICIVMTLSVINSINTRISNLTENRFFLLLQCKHYLFVSSKIKVYT